MQEVDGEMQRASGTVAEQLAATQSMAEEIHRIAAHAEGSVQTLRLGVESTGAMVTHAGQTINKLAQYDVPDRVLRIALADHVLWKKRLVDMATGGPAMDPAELSNERSCRLGKWYFSHDSCAFHDRSEWGELALAHEQVHQTGIAAARHLQRGDREEGLLAVEAMEEASEDVMRLLRRLRHAKEVPAAAR